MKSILSFACLTGALVGAAADVSVPFADNGRALQNPFTGWAMHYYDNGAKYGTTMTPGDSLAWFPGCNVVYLRLPWAWLEPKEGQYNWAAIDTPAQRWIERGGQIAFRITVSETYEATPRWVAQAGAKTIRWNWPTGPAADGKYWECVPDDPIFLEKFGNFLRAFAARYDGRKEVAFVDIGSVGVWGEGHTGRTIRLTPEETQRIVRLHTDLHRRYFKKTLLVVNDDFTSSNRKMTSESIEEALRLGLGWRDDSIMVNGAGTGGQPWWHEQQGQAFAEKAPTVIEFGHYGILLKRKNWNVADLLRSVEAHRATYLSIHGDPRTIYEENRAAVEQVTRRLGYRLVPVEVKYADEMVVSPDPAAAEPFSVTFAFANVGVARPSFDAYPCLTVKNAEGGILAVLADGDFNLREVPPSTPDARETKRHATRFTMGRWSAPTIPPGTHEVYLSVGSADGTPICELPIDAPCDGHRRYRVGTVTIREPQRAYIWPKGKMPAAQTNQIAAMTSQSRSPDFVADAHREPYLEWYAPPAESNRNGICMMLISGGGYYSCCDTKLIDDWRRKFTAIGCQCVNFVYRTPRPVGKPYYASAWMDGQRAVRCVRAEAAKRGLTRIGTISMSAGSHLNTLLATTSLTPAYEPVDELDAQPCSIDFAITCAIAYGLTDGLGIANTREGATPDVRLDSIFKFDAKTCPMCMFHGGRDVYSPTASTRVARELRSRGIPCELHLYADRPHGFFGWKGEGPAATGYDTWFTRAAEFIRQMNYDGRLGKESERRVYTGAWTQARVLEPVWPEGKMPSVQTNQTYAPTLEWFLPKELKTKAIQIITPGGGYEHCNVKGEGEPVAEAFNRRGMTAVVLRYRTPRPLDLAKHVTAWQDAQRAIRLVRHEAKGRGLDPTRLGLMGFSAGGHLTLMCATSSGRMSYQAIDEIDRESCAVQWACPIYPAYVLTDGAHSVNANGGNGEDDVIVGDFAFDRDTPPMCFVHGDFDKVAAMDSVKVWEKLRRMGIQSDLHTLATRNHCFQFSCADATGSASWIDRVWEFLTAKGLNR